MRNKQVNAPLPCNTQIDYSTIIGDRILPFLIELNQATSVLYPAPGQNQRFCYKITGIGSDTPIYADLSHLVFVICNQITQNQIVNISVFINGMEQEASFENGKIELKTPAQPDPPTGCPGLKADFGLNKVNGVMDICFELTTEYPVGPMNVCLFGGGTTASGLSICGPVCESPEPPTNCQPIGYQRLTVCSPVTVTPYATLGTITTHCCGNPTVTPGTTCAGTVNGSCTFTISQQLCVEVPITFGASASVGTTYVQCGQVSSEDICENCSVIDNATAKIFENLQSVFNHNKGPKINIK